MKKGTNKGNNVMPFTKRENMSARPALLAVLCWSQALTGSVRLGQRKATLCGSRGLGCGPLDCADKVVGARMILL
jgi:hypothetical protein